MIPLSLIIDSLLRSGSLELKLLSSAYGVQYDVLKSALMKLDGLSIQDEKVVVDNRLALSLSFIRMGGDPLIVSRHLTWRDFEEEVSRLLIGFGYKVVRGYRLKTPRRGEIDVLASSDKCNVISIDCKHWSYRSMSKSKLIYAARRHLERTGCLQRDLFLKNILVEKCMKKSVFVVPVLVTLHEKLMGVLEGVVIVPIFYFRSFINELYKLPENVRVFVIEPRIRKDST